MNTDQVEQLLGWHTDAAHVLIVVAIVGRIWRHAGGVTGIWTTLTTRGGIVGVVKALIFGHPPVN